LFPRLYVLVLEGEVQQDIVRALLGKFQCPLVMLDRPTVVAQLAVDARLVQVYLLVVGFQFADGIEHFQRLVQATHVHEHDRLAEHDVKRPRMLLLGQVEHLLGLARVVLLQVVIDDQLELLHIEEEAIVPVEHGLVPLYTASLVFAVGQGLVTFVHVSHPARRGVWPSTGPLDKNRGTLSGMSGEEAAYEQDRVHRPS